MLPELQPQRVHEVIGQHVDEPVPLDAPVYAVEHRAQAQVGLEGPEHRRQLCERDVGAPQGGVVLLATPSRGWIVTPGPA